ncbi:MAG: hypothetical protein HY040_11285 [Planctomycetes bacterium]|nr:hypothetical protein [Planctomycetota bacterium]
MKWVDELAVRLQPHRKTLGVVIVLSMLGAPVLPALVCIAFNAAVLALVLGLICFALYTWSVGLFLISHWFDPETGASLRALKSKDLIGKIHIICYRYFFGPLMMLMCFLSPVFVIVLCVMFP